MNGYIQPQINHGGGFDDNGEPIPSTPSWGENIECKYFANTLNNRGRYEGGEFTQSAYEITIYDMEFHAEYIRLLDSRGNEVIEKKVQSLEVLEEVQRVKITI